MGNNNQIKSDTSFGSILVETDQKSYFADDQIDGVLILNLFKDFPSNTIRIVISGKEKTSIEKKNFENEFWNHEFPLFSFRGDYFEKGQYVFPFSFKLPENLPSSFFWKDEKNNFGIINYKIWGGLKNNRLKTYFYSNFEFEVDEIFKEKFYLEKKQLVQKIGTYCGKKSEMVMECKIMNRSFAIGKKAHLLLSINNLECDFNIDYFECVILQKMEFFDKKNKKLKVIKREFMSLNLPGILSGSKKDGENALDFKMEIFTNDEKICTCDGKFIKSKFFIKIRPFFEKIVKNQKVEELLFEIKVFSKKPVVFETNFQVPGWKPQRKETLYLNFNEGNKISNLKNIFKEENENTELEHTNIKLDNEKISDSKNF